MALPQILVRSRKDCSGHWVTETACTVSTQDKDCARYHQGTICAPVTAPCEDPPGSGVLATGTCMRCREPSPLATPLPCTECAANPNAMCGVSEHEVLLRTVKDLNASGRALTYLDPPPTGPDTVVGNQGWDEPKNSCFSQVLVTNNTASADQVYIVLDVSGSMDEKVAPNSTETKLEYAKAALRSYVDLRRFDTLPLGLSFFDHEVNPVLPEAPGMKQIAIGAANAGVPKSVSEQILDATAAMKTRNGSTAIGNALKAAVEAFRAAGSAADRRIYILTDGMNNVGPEADSQEVKDALKELDIHVDIAPIGTQVDQARLDHIADLSAGSVRGAPQGDYVPDIFADFGMGEESDSLVLPETESLVYDQVAFDAAHCTLQSCISPLIHAPLSTNETHDIDVEAGAQSLEVLLVSRQPWSATWNPDFQLVDPPGTLTITPGDSAYVVRDAGHSCGEISTCRYWSRVVVPNPVAGKWHLRMATTRSFQASFVSARVRNPALQCFVSMDEHFVPNGKSAKIVVSARSTHHPVDARTYAVTGVVRGPDAVAHPLTFAVDRFAVDHATATFDGYVGRGIYTVDVKCSVPQTAQLVPTEPTSPGASVVVPSFTRYSTQRFLYDTTTQPPGITPDDCDFDTIPDSIEGTGDTDGDGFSDKCDSDSDNDGLSDSGEGDTDTDGDGFVDYKDEDSDNDGLKDEGDNCRKVSNPSQSDIDFDHMGDACDTDMDGDGVGNAADNCPTVSNTNQADNNGNGIGDACEGGSGCTPVIVANSQSIARCLGDVAPTAVTASAICGGMATPLFGRVTSVNGFAITSGATFIAGTQPELPTGTVVIQWKATGPNNITVTKSQTVTITASDTAAACCKPGSTIVNGTFWPETLFYPLPFNYCVFGSGGNDLITGGLGPDLFSGGDGADDLLGISGFDTLIGGTGDDDITLTLGGIAYGGVGNDTLTSIFGPSTINGDDGNDTIFGSPFPDDITPGAGVDLVAAGLGDDVVHINAACEAGALEALDGGLGFDTLYTAVPLSMLQQLGVVVVGFENIVVTGNSNVYKSSCGIVPCTPASCAPLPWCGTALLSSCPGQLITCPCGGTEVCRSGGQLAAPGVVGICGP